MKALVTGAGGFVGANLVRHLLDRGDQPVAVLRPEGGSWRLHDIAADAQIQHVDLTRPDDVMRAVHEVRPDVIFNLAAYGGYSWQTDFDEMMAVNVRATEALLAAARRVDARFVQAGSSSEYGFQDRAPAESDLIRPNSHYAVTKATATHLCQLAAARYDQHAVTLRLYSVYGPWEEPGRLMPTVVDRALEGTYPPLVAPETARDFVWIDDVCDALVRAASPQVRPDLVLNIASGAQTTLRSLIAAAQEVFDLTGEPTWGEMQRRMWDTTIWVGDASRATETIGWRATTTVRDGLSRLGEWMRADSQRRARYDRGRLVAGQVSLAGGQGHG